MELENPRIGFGETVEGKIALLGVSKGYGGEPNDGGVRSRGER